MKCGTNADFSVLRLTVQLPNATHLPLIVSTPTDKKNKKMLFSNIRQHTLHLCSYSAHLTQTKRVHYVLLCKYSISTRVHNTSTNNANLTPPTRFLLHR